MEEDWSTQMVRLIRENPHLIGPVMARCGIDVPKFDKIIVLEEDFSEPPWAADPRPRGELVERAEDEDERLAVVSTQTLLALLDGRGIAVGEEEHERIVSCRDLDQILFWFEQLPVANSIEDLFGRTGQDRDAQVR